MKRTALLAAALLAGGIGLAGCGGKDDGGAVSDGNLNAADVTGSSNGGGSGSGGGSCAGELGGPGLCVTIDITGAKTVKADIKALVPTSTGVDPASCAAYGAGEKDSDGELRYTLPNFLSNTNVGGTSTFVLDGEVDEYAGPGTYSKEQTAGQGTPLGFSIDGHPFVADSEASTVTVVAGADGSGSLTFTGFTGNDDPAAIDGTLKWRCTDS